MVCLCDKGSNVAWEKTQVKPLPSETPLYLLGTGHAHTQKTHAPLKISETHTIHWILQTVKEQEIVKILQKRGKGKGGQPQYHHQDAFNEALYITPTGVPLHTSLTPETFTTAPAALVHSGSRRTDAGSISAASPLGCSRFLTGGGETCRVCSPPGVTSARH